MDKIVCLGKNYREHMKELGDAPVDKPVIFIKPPSSLRQILAWGDQIEVALPTHRGETHHECEIVFKIASPDKTTIITPGKWIIEGVTLGLDLTLRDVQSKCKKNGHPWEIGKVFPNSAIIGPFIPFEQAKATGLLLKEFCFSNQNVLKQKGLMSQMTMSIQEALPYIDSHFPICDGDLIFTGTPAGVGPLYSGDCSEVKWGKYAYKVLWN